LKSVLPWIEGALIASGAALSIWCGVTIIELWYFNSLPIPPSMASREVGSRRGTASRNVVWPGESPMDSARRSATIEPGAWLARLEAPAIGFSTTVLEGADDKTLARAAGHVEETAFPGEAGNTVIAGHRDTVFRPVRNLHVGDALVLTTSEYIYRYRITGKRIVRPDKLDLLEPTTHRVLTLVTCYPFTFIGHAPQRFIVRADLDAEEARFAKAR
jgi:LPXTG-site transpeptidase (sortase) family protein